jgi:ribosomal protein L22
VHFKHTREIMHTIKGMKLGVAKKFLQDVIE